MFWWVDVLPSLTAALLLAVLLMHWMHDNVKGVHLDVDMFQCVIGPVTISQA